MVVKRGMNDHGILAMADRFRGTGVILRFIEYMDVGATNGWRLDDVVPSSEIVSAIDGRWPLEPVDPAYVGEVAARYRYRDGGGEIGLISSVTQPFCHDCTRARLSAEGKLYTCLFAVRGHDLRALVRSEISDAELDEKLRTLWRVRDDRYSELRSQNTRSTCPRSRCRTSGARRPARPSAVSRARATSRSMRTCSRRIPSPTRAAGASARGWCGADPGDVHALRPPGGIGSGAQRGGHQGHDLKVRHPSS